MKYILTLAVALMAVAAAVSVQTPRSSAQKGPIGKAQHPVPNRYIVVVDENAVRSDAASPAVEAHGQFLSSLYGGSVIKVYSNALKGIVIEMTSQQAEALNTDPSVKSVEEDGFIYTSATQTSAPWHLDRVDQRLTVGDCELADVVNGLVLANLAQRHVLELAVQIDG